ncbi:MULTISPECIES: type II toxin-antitoxin system RelE/ParE family toxin [unclassified Microcoleus]|uniref:type II toxin-antitoxin system RelE/ParE family toxin n=1 Tax=unclassified Microcoleus TaxID=2642155 RepID=UPI002FCE6ED0
MLDRLCLQLLSELRIPSPLGRGVCQVLHAFQKKTQKTAKKNIEIGQKRYQQLLQNRLNSREPEP